MAKQSNSKVPKIRFKGFEDEWGDKKLGSLCEEFHSGKFIRASEISKTGSYPVYGGNGVRGFSKTYNHDGLYALIGRQGALCGNLNLFLGKAFFTEHAVAVQANGDNETHFLFYLLGRMNLGQYSAQSAQPGLAVNKIQQLISPVCEKIEQKRISGFFRELDQLLELHQRKHDKLVTLKKAMLQKMFPQPGTTAPKIRFKGFSRPWGEKPIGEILSETKRSIVLEDNTQYELVTVKRRNGGVVSRGRLWGREILVKNYSRLETGDFLISKRQVVHGATGIVPPALNNAIVSNEYLVAVANGQITTEFLTILASLPDMLQKFFLSSYGVDIEKLFFDVEDWKKRTATIPMLPEQTQISRYFRTLDELISKHSVQLEKLKQIKSACLERMFV